MSSLFKVTLSKQEQNDSIVYLHDVASQVKLSKGTFFMSVSDASDIVMSRLRLEDDINKCELLFEAFEGIEKNKWNDLISDDEK